MERFTFARYRYLQNIIVLSFSWRSSESGEFKHRICWMALSEYNIILSLYTKENIWRVYYVFNLYSILAILRIPIPLRIFFLSSTLYGLNIQPYRPTYRYFEPEKHLNPYIAKFVKQIKIGIIVTLNDLGSDYELDDFHSV